MMTIEINSIGVSTKIFYNYCKEAGFAGKSVNVKKFSNSERTKRCIGKGDFSHRRSYAYHVTQH